MRRVAPQRSSSSGAVGFRRCYHRSYRCRCVGVKSDRFTGRRLDTLSTISRGVVEVVESVEFEMMLLQSILTTGVA
jgi:hypothetical protein